MQLPRPSGRLGIQWRTYIREWREHRGLTQEQLADAVGTSGSVISLLEAGKRQPTAKWLNKIAPVLRTSPGFLIDHDPKKLPVNLLDIWLEIPEEDKDAALRVLRTFTRGARATE